MTLTRRPALFVIIDDHAGPTRTHDDVEPHGRSALEVLFHRHRITAYERMSAAMESAEEPPRVERRVRVPHPLRSTNFNAVNTRSRRYCAIGPRLSGAETILAKDENGEQPDRGARRFAYDVRMPPDAWRRH